MFDIFKRKEQEVKPKEEFVFKPENYKKVSVEQAKSNHTFLLKEDVHLIIEEYLQYNVNSGILLGMPTDLSHYFEDSFKKARLFFNDEFFVIDPVLFTDKDSSNIDTYLLPKFVTMAIIDRTLPLDGEDFACATLRVMWWQNSLGVPEPEILEQIKGITWQKPYAYSWDF